MVRKARRSKSETLVVEGKRIKGHWRNVRLRDGRVTRFFVREHVRTGKKKAHRLSSLPYMPLYQREMLERQGAQIRAATSDRPDESYISPEESAAQAYMDRQRRLVRQFRRRR